MLREMTHREFLTWSEFARLDPFPSERQRFELAFTRMVIDGAIDQMKCALLNQIVALAGHTGSNRARDRKLKDYILNLGEPEAPTRKQTPKQQWNALAKMARALTGGNKKMLEQVEYALKKGPPKESA